MWTIFKVFAEFVTMLFRFYVLVCWLPGKWNLRSPSRNGAHTFCTGKQSLKPWTAREVLKSHLFNTQPCLPASAFSALVGFCEVSLLVDLQIWMFVNYLPWWFIYCPLLTALHSFIVLPVTDIHPLVHWIYSLNRKLRLLCLLWLCLRASGSHLEEGSHVSSFYHENQRSLLW